MNSLIHADIFFFITTIALIAFSIIGVVALIYIIKILVDARFIVRAFRGEVEGIIVDIKDFRSKVKEGGAKFRLFADLFKKIITKTRKTRTTTRNRKEHGTTE
ncbi:MAG: hypothetical protein WC757_00885 [Candidatus Paceibacterota bacterium]|jgi:hypothetical protein